MKYLLINDFKYLSKKPIKLFIVVLVTQLIFQSFFYTEDSLDLILGRNLTNIQNYIAILFS